MKNKLILLLILITFSIQAQFEYEPDTTSVLCKKELIKAEKDFNNNDYTLKIQKTVWVSKTQIQLIEQYGVKVESSRFHINNCYDYKIEKLLDKKYGFSFLKHTQEKAKSLDESGKGNRKASFINKKKNLKEYVIDNLSKKQFRYLRKKYGTDNIWIVLVIDNKGYCNIEKIGFLEEFDVTSFQKSLNNINEISEPIISDLINHKLLYTPKTENGIPITDKVISRINLVK